MKKELKNFIGQTLANCPAALSSSDYYWVLDVLKRRPDSFDYFRDFALKVSALQKLDKDSFEYLNSLYEIHKELEKYKVFFFKQHKVLIAVPQRKRHPLYPAPNLGGFVTPQNYRTKGEVCYGLNYVDARYFLVEQALKDPEITDILFLDDDILLPLDALTVLCDTNEAIVGANYVKKRYPIESNALTVVKAPEGYHNKEVKPEQGSIKSVPVSQMGLGCCLISVEVFKKIPKEKWFGFMYNEDGSLFRSEDVQFFQEAIIAGFEPKIIPGLCCAHVNFNDGKIWGPEWLVEDFELKEEFKDKYCFMLCDPSECIEKDI